MKDDEIIDVNVDCRDFLDLAKITLDKQKIMIILVV